MLKFCLLDLQISCKFPADFRPMLIPSDKQIHLKSRKENKEVNERTIELITQYSRLLII